MQFILTKSYFILQFLYEKTKGYKVLLDSLEGSIYPSFCSCSSPYFSLALNSHLFMLQLVYLHELQQGYRGKELNAELTLSASKKLISYEDCIQPSTPLCL